MLKTCKLSMQGMQVSASGNVAQYTVEKAMALCATAVTVSDLGGNLVDGFGFHLRSSCC